jgi:hypothetical protein
VEKNLRPRDVKLQKFTNRQPLKRESTGESTSTLQQQEKKKKKKKKKKKQIGNNHTGEEHSPSLATCIVLGGGDTCVDKQLLWLLLLPLLQRKEKAVMAPLIDQCMKCIALLSACFHYFRGSGELGVRGLIHWGDQLEMAQIQ